MLVYRKAGGPESTQVPDHSWRVPHFLLKVGETHVDILEVTSAGVLEDGLIKGTLSAPGIEEVRTWDLYRAYPCVAQENLGAPAT